MSTYERLPNDPLVLVSCIESVGSSSSTKASTVAVNLTDPLPFKCTEVLNQYHRRGYNVAAHSLWHEPEGLFSDGYFVGTWTMAKPSPVEVKHDDNVMHK